MTLKLVQYLGEDDWPGIGLLVDDEVYDLDTVATAAGADADTMMDMMLKGTEWIIAAPENLDFVRGIAHVTEHTSPAKVTRLLAPVYPAKLFCLATNFMSHMQEGISKQLQGGEQKRELETPRVFMKPTQNTVIGSGENLALSNTAQLVDYEAELAIVIGEATSEVSVEEASARIAGVTIINDISERQLHIWDREEERDWDKFFDWLNGKWCDGFAPMGPCVVPTSEIGSPDDLEIIMRLNGEVMQQANTSEMIFSCAEAVSYISHICTLECGDVIAMGTPAGVGQHRGIRLKDGDVMEVEIPEIGVLRTPVVGP